MNTDLYVYRIWAYDGRRTPQIPGHGPEWVRDRKLRFWVKAFTADDALKTVLEISGRTHAEIRRVRQAWPWEGIR